MESINETGRQDGTSRRNVITSIGLAAAAAAVAPAIAKAAAPAANETFWDKEYTAKKGDVKLQLYRRRMKAPALGHAPLTTLIMVHEIGRAHV